MGRIIEDWMLDLAEERREKDFKKGFEEGREIAFLNSINNLVFSLNLTPKEAMDVLKIPAAEQPKYLAMALRQQ